MINNYLVAGTNWTAEVDIDDSELLTKDDLIIEASSRAIEAFFEKRDDIKITEHAPIKLSTKNKHQLAFIDLLTTELIKGCGIGMLICVIDKNTTGDASECYISSKVVLQNVGIASNLIEAFDKQYPDKDIKTSIKKSKKS